MIKKLMDPDTVRGKSTALISADVRPAPPHPGTSTDTTVGRDASVIETRLEELERLQHELEDGRPLESSQGAVAAKSLSIVVPVYNEVATIRTVLNKLLDLDLKLDKEVIVVDDGSTDGTGEILARL